MLMNYKIRAKNMKYKVLSFSLIFSLLVSLLSACSISKAKDLELTIVHTNDIHGRIVENKDNKIIGYSKMSTYISDLKSQKKNVWLMDIGDVLHGQTIVTLPKGQTAVDLMNIMGYNYFVPGNHDFNYGYERLVELSKQMKFKTLAANILKKDGESLFTQNDIVETDGVKIGFFGLATPEVAIKTNPKNVEGLEIKDPVEVAKEQVKLLKKSGASLIIALSHLGIDEESKGHRSYDVRDQVDGIDLIIDGHSHTAFDKIEQVEGKAIITSTGAYGSKLGVVDISIKNNKKIIQPKNIEFSEFANVSSNQKIDEYINEATKSLGPVLNTVLGSTEVYLEGKKSEVRVNETNLTKLTLDAILKETKADVALINGGGFRDSIDIGNITMNKVLTVFPFGNYVITKSVKGSDIVKALELGFSNYPSPSGGLSQIAGMTCTIDSKAAAGSRVASVVIEGKPIDLEKEYVLATNDFVASGGDGYDMIAKSKTVNEFSGLDEIISAYIKKISPIKEEILLPNNIIIK